MIILKALIIMACVYGDLPITTNSLYLLMETCAVESDMGQTSKNIMQMEEATRRDMIINYIAYNPQFIRLVNTDINNPIDCIQLAMLHYIRTGEKIPDTRIGRAHLWKNRYNTHLGKGTVDDYMNKAQYYLGDEVCKQNS